MGGQYGVEHFGRQKVDRRPAGQCHSEPQKTADQQEDDGRDGIRLDQVFCRPVDLQAGIGADTEYG